MSAMGTVPLTQSDSLIPRVEQTRHTAAICKSSRAGLARSSVSAATVGVGCDCCPTLMVGHCCEQCGTRHSPRTR